jgi:hypothetical protein
MINWKRFGGSGRGLILRHYSGIRLEGLRKTTKNSIRIAGYRGQDLKPGPPEYEAAVLTTRSRHSVRLTPTRLVTSHERIVTTNESGGGGGRVIASSNCGIACLKALSHNSPRKDGNAADYQPGLEVVTLLLLC